MTMWVVKVFVYFAMIKLSLGEEYVQLNIIQGTLRGLKKITAFHGMPYYSFKGIPYAKPNVGRDKFNVAAPLDRWSGVWDATKFGSWCPQMHEKQAVGDENCLFINVYTPDLNENSKKAVMVFIHGGAFIVGNSDPEPDFLIEKDVILVSMNYRLGAIGFLNTGDSSAPGNLGLKDQNLALKWVQKNIINFGGCPKRVTLFGQSAGAASVHFHMMSPMSQGLFNAAIIQSGTALCPWAYTYNPKDNAMKFAKNLGINFSNTSDLVEKLKDKSSNEICEAADKMRTITDPQGIFVPSVEADVGQDRFIIDDPWKILTSGKIIDVPVMIGVTENELGYTMSALVSMISLLKDPLAVFIPRVLNVTDQAQKKQITRKFSKFYFNGLPMVLNPIATGKVLNDAMFNHESIMSAEIMNARISSPVWSYLFNYYSKSLRMKGKLPMELGAMHADDLVFMFYSPERADFPEPGSQDEQKVNEIIEMWTNFAKDGNPTATMESVKVVWEPTNANRNYLDISSELKLKNFLWKDRVKLWANMYKNIIGDYVKLF